MRTVRPATRGPLPDLKRGYGWDRTRLAGTEGARIWTGQGVFAHNLVKVGAGSPAVRAPGEMGRLGGVPRCFRHHQPVHTEGRAGYGAVLRNREYLALLVSQSLSVVGDQVAQIALALLVYQRTGSAFAAAATFATAYGAAVVVGPVVSTLADRYPRRTVMVISDILRGLLVLLLAVSPPTPLLYVIIALVGAVSPAFNSARSATLPDVLGEDYVTGQGLNGSAVQASQVLGFGLGGALVAIVGTGGALLADAATFAVSAAAVRFVLQHRPAVGEAHGGLLRETLRGASTVRRSPDLRYWLAWGLLLAAAAAAPEGLAVALSDAYGGGEVAAGLLTAAGPLGFVLGTLVVLRVPVDRRVRLLPWGGIVAFAPLVLTASAPYLPVVMALWALAGVGGALQVVPNARYVLASPAALRGRLFGVAGTAMMACQGAVLVAAGAVASLWRPGPPPFASTPAAPRCTPPA